MSSENHDLNFDPTLQGLRPQLRLLNRFTLIRQLGRGGMGVVWLANDERLEREVALKFLPEALQGDKTTLAGLRRETKRSLDLTHPNIVRIYDLVEDRTVAAIAMEYIDGSNLSDMRLEKLDHAFDVADIARWTSDLCDVLTYAHHQVRLVHRDIKPSNLMITGAGQLKVADFGISRRMTDSASLQSRRPSVSGTLPYMSPQQIIGSEPQITDDIYSVGATLYDLLTGRPPFHSGDITHQVLEQVPALVGERRIELGISKKQPLPRHWELTIASCLAKNPAHRPQTAQDLKQMLEGKIPPPELRRADAEGTDKDTITVSLQALTQQPRRFAWLMGALGGGVLLAAAMTAGWYWGRGVGIEEQKTTFAREEQARTDARIEEEKKNRFEGTQPGEKRLVQALNTTFVWVPPGKAEYPAETNDGKPRVVQVEKGFWMAERKLNHLRMREAGGDRVHLRQALIFLLETTMVERAAGRLPQDWFYAIPDVDVVYYASADLLKLKSMEELRPYTGPDRMQKTRANNYGLFNLIDGPPECVWTGDKSWMQRILNGDFATATWGGPQVTYRLSDTSKKGSVWEQLNTELVQKTRDPIYRHRTAYSIRPIIIHAPEMTDDWVRFSWDKLVSGDGVQVAPDTKDFVN